MPYLYILKCNDGSFYTGSTQNLRLRMAQHACGKGATYTKERLPVELVYYEEFERITDAYRREKQIQGWSHQKKEALIKGDEDRLIEFSKNHGL